MPLKTVGLMTVGILGSGLLWAKDYIAAGIAVFFVFLFLAVRFGKDELNNWS